MMKKNPPLPIPMIDAKQTVLNFIREKFITYDELSSQLGYDVADNTIKNWLIGRYNPPVDFQDKSQKNIGKLNQYSEWKLRYGVFEKYRKRKPQGFWKIKKTHRYALQWLCEKKGWEFPYGLYQLKKDTLFDLNIDGITNIYSESPFRIVTSVLPEYEWHIWKFHMTPMGYWLKDENKKNYLKWFERIKMIENPEDWYSVDIDEIKQNFGGTLAVTYFSGSILRIVKFLYPNYKFNIYKFKKRPHTSINFESIENYRKYVDKIAQKLEFKFPNDYYKLSHRKHLRNIKWKKIKVNSLSEFLNKLYPHQKFYPWLFEGGVANGFWKDVKNIQSYAKWLFLKLKLNSLDDWYDVNNNIVQHFNGSGLLNHGLGQKSFSIAEMVRHAYPHHKWDISKFGQKKFTSQKRLYNILNKIFANNEILYSKVHSQIINPKTKRKLTLDCYIPDLKIAFEYQGSQHKKKNRFFHSKSSRDSFKDLQYRDRIKKKKCKELGIKLVEVFEGQWDYTKDGLLKIINN